MAEISVIIPVYNVEDYLEECLNTILNQSFTDLEIICVNDGSTDNSLDILNKYANKDNRLRIITQENKGLSAARNSGLNMATGDYIYFIDSDDYLELDALNELYYIAKEKEVDLIFFKLINFYDESKEEFIEDYHEMYIVTEKFKNKQFHLDEFADYLADIDVTVYTKFFKKELMENIRFDESVIFEDNLFTIEYILNSNNFFFLNKYLYHRRIRNNSIMNSNSKNHMDSINVSNKVIHLMKEYGYYSCVKEKLFTKKVDVVNFRLINIKDEYKEEFFKKIRKDFLDKKEEFEVTLNWDLINFNTKCIFYSALESNNFAEFILKKENFILKNEIENLINEKVFIEEKLAKIQEENYKLEKNLELVNKKIEYLKNELENVYSSNSLKISKFIRRIKK